MMKTHCEDEESTKMDKDMSVRDDQARYRKEVVREDEERERDGEERETFTGLQDNGRDNYVTEMMQLAPTPPSKS